MADDRDEMEVHELYLSGGSFRSAMAAAGAIAYLAHSGRWGGVRLVSSVSGGSLLNGALVAAPLRDDDEPYEAIQGFVERVSGDAGRLFGTRARSLAFAELLVSIAVFAGAFVWLIAQGYAGWAAACGLAILPASLHAFRRYLGKVTADISRVAVGADAVSTGRDDRVREHRISASGLSTATPHVVVWPASELVEEQQWGTLIAGADRESRSGGERSTLSVLQAVVASTSLPGARGVAYVHLAKGIEQPKQWLVDGGVTGTFGDSATIGPANATRHTLAIDGSRHAAPDSGVLRRVGRLSLLYVLYRWLMVGFEGTYVNDLDDRARTNLVRVCRATSSPDSGEGRACSPPTRFEHRLDELRTSTGRIGLLGFNVERAAVAICAGVLSTAVCLRGIDPKSATAEEQAGDLLREIGDRIGITEALLLAWDATARVLFFRLQPNPFSISHHGLVSKNERASIAGYQRAVVAGYRCLQADLLTQEDGDLIVGHAILGRTLPWQSSPRGATGFRQLIETLGNEDLFWNLEVKSMTTLSALVRFLKEEEDHGQLHRYCVSAPFRSRLLRELRTALPQLATNDSVLEGAGTGWPLSPIRRSRGGVGCQLWVALCRWRWQPSLPAALRRGKFVQVYVVDDSATADRLYGLGVTAIISAGDPGAVEDCRERERATLATETVAQAATVLRGFASTRDYGGEQLVKPRVLVAVVGDAGAVSGQDIEYELDVIQGSLFEHGHTLVHIGTEPGDLERLLDPKRSEPLGFELVHLIADVGEQADAFSPASKTMVDLGGKRSTADLASAIAGSTCRLVLITGESGELLARPLAQELGDQLHSCSVAGVPVHRTGDERRRYVQGLYSHLARSSANGAVAQNLAAAALAEMDKGEPGSATQLADAIFFPSTLDVSRGALLEASDDYRAHVARALGGNLWWRRPGMTRSRQSYPPPELPAGADFSVVSWVRLAAGSSATQWWADTRGYNAETDPYPSGVQARGWVTGIYEGIPLLQLNTGSAAPGFRAHSGWYGENFFDFAGSRTDLARRVDDGVDHCIVFSCQWSGSRTIRLFVDGEAVWEGSLEGFEPPALTGTKLLVGTGKDAIEHSEKQFRGDLYLLGVPQRAIIEREAVELTRLMHAQLASWPAA